MDHVRECYMCDAAATSVEHVPPQCFFPEGRREGIITVPSCEKHNEANAKDVEYVRNVISTQHGTNGAAAEIFETSKRSLEHSPRLRTRTFRDLRPVMVDGAETGAFRIDLPRHKRVMEAIAYALYFHDYGRKHRGDWRVFTPSFVYAGTVDRGEPDPWEGFRALIESVEYVAVPVPQPEVFKYGRLELDQGQMIYRFEFYERIVVTAMTLFATYAPSPTIWVPGS